MLQTVNKRDSQTQVRFSGLSECCYGLTLLVNETQWIASIHYVDELKRIMASPFRLVSIPFNLSLPFPTVATKYQSLHYFLVILIYPYRRKHNYRINEIAVSTGQDCVLAIDHVLIKPKNT